MVSDLGKQEEKLSGMSDNAGKHGKETHVGGWGPEILSPISPLDMGVPLPIVVYPFVKQY